MAPLGMRVTAYPVLCDNATMRCLLYAIPPGQRCIAQAPTRDTSISLDGATATQTANPPPLYNCRKRDTSAVRKAIACSAPDRRRASTMLNAPLPAH